MICSHQPRPTAIVMCLTSPGFAVSWYERVITHCMIRANATTTSVKTKLNRFTIKTFKLNLLFDFFLDSGYLMTLLGGEGGEEKSAMIYHTLL